MPNLLQPQGVTLSLDMSQPPATGYFALELQEDGQTTLPNIIDLTGTANDAKLVLNDGLLRTHQDAIHIQFAGNSARLHILGKPIKTADELTKDNVSVAFDLTEAGNYVLQRLNGEYVLSLGTAIKAVTL